MNKAKFLLSAIGVLAVAATAMASKTLSVLYVRTADTTTICELTITNLTTTAPNAQGVVTFVTDVDGAPCPNTFKVTTID